MFSDMQSLQHLRCEILKTASTLESCSNLVIRLKEYCCFLDDVESPNGAHVIASLETYAADIKIYQQNIASITQSLQGIFDLVRILRSSSTPVYIPLTLRFITSYRRFLNLETSKNCKQSTLPRREAWLSSRNLHLKFTKRVRPL